MRLIKVQAMDGWRGGLDFAVVVCPIYQLPRRMSQIYQQAIARNVCIVSYSHLAALALAKQEAIDCLRAEKARLMRLSHRQALDELLRAVGINTRIKQIQKVEHGDIPYGIGADDWDVLHSNTNSALLGSSPAQEWAGAIFKLRGKPLNGWSEADRKIPLQYQAWCESFAADWLRILKPGASAFVFAGRRLSHRCVVAFEDAGFTFRDSLAWLRESAPHRAQRLSVVYERRGDLQSAERWNGWRVGNLRPTYEPVLWFVKPYPIGTTLADNVLNHGVGAFNEDRFVAYERAPDNVLRSGFVPGESGHHLAQKPLKLMRALIELSTQPGQLVLDPFCGSGSTLVAAKAAGRCYLGFELDVNSAHVAQRRLQPDLFDQATDRETTKA